MKKMLCALLCFMLLALPLGALGAARMPELRSSINDSADVLSAQTTEDLTEFCKLVAQKTELNLYVATVHFLDGLDAQTYAAQLFDRWNLGQKDLLLVCAAGEDSFATAMGAEAGQLLGKANADNLLYTSSEFGALFRTQQYDAALAAYCKGLNALLKKQTGTEVRMDGLFGQKAQAAPQQRDSLGGELWREVMEAITETSEDYQTHHSEIKREEEGLTAGGWIVLMILISIVLRQNRRDRRIRRERRSGCGCSPIGWILGLLGLHWMFDKD